MNRIRAACAASIILSLLTPNAGASEDELPFDPGATVQAAVETLQREHLAKRPLNDALSRLWLGKFLNALDQPRLYFLASDLQEFQQFENRLDDLANSSDFQFAELVRKRFRTRVNESVAVAEEFVSTQHDYSVHEKYPGQFDTYATSRDDLRERWRLCVKADLLLEKLHGRQLAEVRSQFSGRYQRVLRQARDMTDERLCEIYLEALISLYDPNSTYLTPRQMMSFRRPGPFRRQSYNPGFQLQQRGGQWAIVSVRQALRDPKTDYLLLGWNLMAIRRTDGILFDVVESDPEYLFGLIQQPKGPLESDSDVILELINPVTLKRATVSWCRFSAF